MKYLIKEMIKPLYYYLKNKNLREFDILYSKYSKNERYKLEKNVKFLSYSFDVPDLASFIYQFKELFVEEIYKFKTSNKKPVIYDCGANIGTASLYFKQEYSTARIKAFEADSNIADLRT